MDGKIDKVREALIGSRFIIDKFTMGTHPALKKIDEAIAALSAIDPEDNALKVGRYFCAQMPCSPTDCTEVPCRYMKGAIANRNNRDPEAIRRECADRAIAYMTDDGTYPAEAWETLRAAIISAEPAQDDGNPDAVMAMIENGDMSISWECSACKKLIDDREDIEAVKICPHCGASIGDFLYIEEAKE